MGDQGRPFARTRDTDSVPAIREVLRRTTDASLERLRKRGRASIAWMVRLTAAATASYIVASRVFPNSAPLLAPLTALLVVQLTPVSILASGIERVASVVAGVSVAVGFSSVFGLHWWSLATVIAVSLLIGQLLRLGANLVEVPISAMLVLGVGANTAEAAAWQRIAETLVGAAVGVLSNLLFPPKLTSEDAAMARLTAFGRRALPQIEIALHTAPEAGRARLFQVLATIGDEEAVPILRHFAVYDGSPALAETCASVLRTWSAGPGRRADRARQALEWVADSRAHGEGPLRKPASL